MKRILLSIFTVITFSATAQTTVFTENFDAFENLAAQGWAQTNQSSPLGLGTWQSAAGNSFGANPYNGNASSFAVVNYTSTTYFGTISNWLITPVITVANGDVVTFYTRQAEGEVQYGDRLEVRMSASGAASVLPAGEESVGDYTTLIASVNPDLLDDGYPLTWTPYTYTVTGLSEPTEVKIGFRYYVIEGGTFGNYSNMIGIDALSISRPLSTTSFFKSNFTMYPNPAKKVLNISGNAGLSMENVVITDLNGRVVKQQNLGGVASSEINVADLTSGMYLITISSAEGKGTSKFMKN